MDLLVLKNLRIYYFIENIKSENLGFYFSFFLHLVIILFAVGIPNFFGSRQINLPTIIPIEIVNISEVTSLTKDGKNTKQAKNKILKIKEKKFNSSNNQEIKKIDIKDKKITKKNDLNKKITTKQEIVINEKKKVPVEIKKKEIDLVEKNIESFSIDKLKPRLKPKPQIKEKIKSDLIVKEKPQNISEEFNIASMLKDLRNEKTILKNDDNGELVKEKVNEQIEENDQELAQLSISEIDLLRQQLSSCWNAPAGAVIEKGMLVKISAKIKQNRRIFENTVRIIDTNISKSNSFYGPITESAMRTLLNPDCVPLKLPEDKYSLWKNLTITFDYSIMKGY